MAPGKKKKRKRLYPGIFPEEQFHYSDPLSNLDSFAKAEQEIRLQKLKRYRPLHYWLYRLIEFLKSPFEKR